METQLFNKKENCCACSACFNICPKNAISFQEDSDGFVYPYINKELCINCGLCQKVCNYQKDEVLYEPQKTYAAITNNTEILLSASGGVFASFAKSFLDDGGVVYGATLECKEGKPFIFHLGIENEEEIPNILGSKYVQSSIGKVFQEIKEKLKSGKKVLFCGTPCQVDGLRGYLGKDFSNLLLIDLICHGVPSQKFFRDYIREIYPNKSVRNFKFRDKKHGWGYNGRIDFEHGISKCLYKNESSYYEYFLKGTICRENCYVCKYASNKRIGDITIGDFWGIGKEHPEWMKENGGMIDTKKGVSCILINTEKGKNYLEHYKNVIKLWECKLQEIVNHNRQLKEPIHLNSKIRDRIFAIYKENGYKGVEKMWKKDKGFKLPLIRIKNRLKNFLLQ